MPVTVSIGGQPPQTFETPWAAMMALLKHLPTKQLGGQRWMDVVRFEKQSRTDGLPGSKGDVGTNAIPEKNPGG